MPKLVQDSRGRHELLARLDFKSQKELAEESGVRQPALSLIANQHRMPGRVTASRLAKIGIEFESWTLAPTKAQLAREVERQKESAA